MGFGQLVVTMGTSEQLGGSQLAREIPKDVGLPIVYFNLRWVKLDRLCKIGYRTIIVAIFSSGDCTLVVSVRVLGIDPDRFCEFGDRASYSVLLSSPKPRS